MEESSRRASKKQHSLDWWNKDWPSLVFGGNQAPSPLPDSIPTVKQMKPGSVRTWSGVIRSPAWAKGSPPDKTMTLSTKARQGRSGQAHCPSADLPEPRYLPKRRGKWPPNYPTLAEPEKDLQKGTTESPNPGGQSLWHHTQKDGRLQPEVLHLHAHSEVYVLKWVFYLLKPRSKWSVWRFMEF